MSDDEILLDVNMEVGHGNNTPPTTHPPTSQMTSCNKPEQQPPPIATTSQRTSRQPSSSPTLSQSHSLTMLTICQAVATICQLVEAVALIQVYIYTHVSCLKTPYAKIR